MKSIHPSRFLQLALLADAAVTAAVAAPQLLLTGFLAELLQLPRALLLETGVFLAAYVIGLLVLARSRRVWSAWIGLIVVGNVGWALACLALLASGAASPNALGTGFVLIQAAAVLLLARLEFKGWLASPAADPVRPSRAF